MHQCPKCGKTFDKLYTIESTSQEPYTAMDAVKGLAVYGPLTVQKVTVCHQGDMLHFQFIPDGEERLVQLLPFNPDALATAKRYWEENAETCQHEGCEEEGTPCYLNWSDTEPDSFYCTEHAFDAGFCWMCGLFNAGIESFDFGKYDLCEDCADQYEADYYEPDDEADYAIYGDDGLF